MPQPNGKTPQHHLSIAELVERARVRRSDPWHWPALDLDVLVRPRTHEENANAMTEITVLQAVAPSEAEMDMAEIKRVELRHTLPCLLWPDGTPIFTADDLDAAMRMDSVTLMQAIEKVNSVSNFTKEQAEEAEKNSVRTDAAAPSLLSPDEAETSAPLPTPTP